MSSDEHATSVVIVDDDDAGRRLLRRVLERRGYVVADASNGRAGLDLMLATPPRIALLDLRMPGELSGIDVIREMRAHPATQDIPVIIVSASVHSGARALALEVGAVGFVEKPIDFNELYDTLERALAGTTDPV